MYLAYDDCCFSLSDIDNSSGIVHIWSNVGREVRIGKNCGRGLEYVPRPQAEGRAQDQGHSLSQYGPT